MRAIFFDLDGTLLHVTRDYDDILAGAVRDVLGSVPEGFLAEYNETFFDLLDNHEPEPVRQTFAVTLDGLDVGADADPAALTEALLKRETEAFRPPEGVEEDLARIARDHSLGVLTNGVPSWQRHKLEAHGLDGHFDAFVSSYEAGAHKPDPAPFRLAEERLPAEAYAMIGDDDADVDGAEGVGWIAHRYDGDGFGDLPGAFAWE